MTLRIRSLEVLQVPLMVGLAGGICLHSPRFRDVVGSQMRRLIPSRFVR